jgi:hypothetical protein
MPSSNRPDQLEPTEPAEPPDEQDTAPDAEADVLRPTSPQPFDDDATRHLSAAVYVDDRFGEEIIDEFLRHPTRAIPPSPGMDPLVVLSEAVAARRRRVLRDSVLLALLVAIVVIGWPYSLLWLVLAIVGLSAEGAVRAQKDNRSAGRRSNAAWITLVIILALLGFVLWLFLTNQAPSDEYDDPNAAGSSGGGTSVPTLLLVLFAVGLVGTVLVERTQVHTMLRGRFARTAWHQVADHRAELATNRTAWYANRLAMFGTSAGASNTHVHHGYKAFVGSGTLVQKWEMAIRLQPKEGQAASAGNDEPKRLAPAAIYRAVNNRVLAMRDSDALAPGQRLGTLRTGQEVIASAEALLRYRDTDPVARAILTDGTRPPANTIPAEVIDEMIGRPPEWIRPYLAVHVEGWHRELVVSSYLNAGCDNDTLYLEWRAYQLNPVRAEYRVEQMDLNNAAVVLRDMLLTSLTLPFTIPFRLRTLWRAATDAGGVTGLDVDPHDPARSYGAQRSIREIAADQNQIISYFQDADGTRFIKLLQEATLAGVDDSLSEHGLSTTEFRGQRNAVINSTVINGGTFAGVNTIGQGNQQQSGAVSVQLGRMHFGQHQSAQHSSGGPA